MRDALLWTALVGLPSCVLGGGPFVAYGEHGWTGGLEGGWSLALAPRVDLRAVHCEST